MSACSGKTPGLGRTREGLPSVGDDKKSNRRSVDERQPEREEARPVVPGERAVRDGGCPGAKRSRRGEEVTDVSRPGSPAGAANTGRSELKSLTRQFSGRKALDGPATRPVTPLAVENSVGKLAADAAPNASTGKRAWRTPIPQFSPCSVTRPGRDFWFLPPIGCD
jgi:hypothetical protein